MNKSISGKLAFGFSCGSQKSKTPVIWSVGFSGISRKWLTGNRLPLRIALRQSNTERESISGISGISGKSLCYVNEPYPSLSLSTSDFEVL